jgi:PAS domain S-box-containing protein
MSERLYDYVIPVNQEFMFLNESMTKKELIRGVFFRRIFAQHVEIIRRDNELRTAVIHRYNALRTRGERSVDQRDADRWMYLKLGANDNVIVKGHIEEIDHPEYSLLVRHQVIAYSLGDDVFESAVLFKSGHRRMKHDEFLMVVWDTASHKFIYSKHARTYLENWSGRTEIDDSFIKLIPDELKKAIEEGQGAQIEKPYTIPIAGLEATDEFDLVCSRMITNVDTPVYMLLFQRTQHHKHSIHFNGEFYRTILNAATVDLCVFDTSQRYLFINKNAVKDDSVREWLIGKTDFEYCAFRGISTSMAEVRKEYFNRCLSTGEPVSLEERFVNQKGEVFYSLKFFKPIADGPNVKYVIGFGIDISKQKQIEFSLRESEEKYRDLFESSLDLIQSVDQSGKFLFCNNAWIQKLGYDFDEIAQMNLFSVIAPDHLPHCMPLFEVVFKGEAVRGVQVAFMSKSGKRLELEGNVVPRIENGKIVATHAFFRDVTERKLQEELLRQSIVEKDSLLGEIHHRVKNNLTVVYSLLELQALQVKDDDVRRVFRESQARIRSMALVHEKLYQSETFSSVDLTSYLNELTAYILRINSGMTRHVDVVFSGENIFVHVNQAVPCGLLANEILTNACKYAFAEVERPKLTVTTKVVDNENYLCIKDNGPGLPEGFNVSKLNTLGFRLIKTFVNQLKGKMEIKTEGGLVYEIKFPKK